MKYIRLCPKCKKELEYKYKSTFITAKKFNSICKSCSAKLHSINKRSADLSSLLKDTYESFYWIGFLLADGSFNDNRLSFGLAEKDKNQIEKFAKFINYKKPLRLKYKKLNNKKFGYYSISVKDIVIVKQIQEKFDIQNNKTENPPKTINKWNRKLLLALFAGFIDGDGSITKKTNRLDSKLRIQIHSSWLNFLEELSLVLFGKNFCTINKRGYANLAIEDFPILRKLKLELLELHIPLMERKWNNVNETYINKIERGQIIRPLIKEDYRLGLTRKEICKKYNVSAAFLTKLFKD